MAGVCFLTPVTDFLADVLPFYGVAFFSYDLLGVYLSTLSTLFLISPDGSADAPFFPPAAFFSFAAAFDAAFFLPLAPPFTLGAPAA